MKISGTRNKTQPAPLRLVFSREDSLDVPRKYDQSTSGRVSSTGTAPPLSLSNAITVDSAIRSFVESAFRRYPKEVPQRAAYASWSSRSKVLRYLLSDSIGQTLPDSNSLAIPFAHSSARPSNYDSPMDREELRRIRKIRLAELVAEFGTQTELAAKMDDEQNYISKLLSPNTPFGEKTARKIELAARKPQGWLDHLRDEEPVPTTGWPFSFSRDFWDRLDPAQQREIDAAVQKMILGASIQDMAVKRPRRKPA